MFDYFYLFRLFRGYNFYHKKLKLLFLDLNILKCTFFKNKINSR